MRAIKSTPKTTMQIYTIQVVFHKIGAEPPFVNDTTSLFASRNPASFAIAEMLYPYRAIRKRTPRRCVDGVGTSTEGSRMKPLGKALTLGIALFGCTLVGTSALIGKD